MHHGPSQIVTASAHENHVPDLFGTVQGGLAFRMAFAQGVALVLECGWIKGLGRLFLQLLPLVLPINT